MTTHARTTMPHTSATHAPTHHSAAGARPYQVELYVLDALEV